MRIIITLLLLSSTALTRPGSGTDKFKQLDELLPTPTEVRIASGQPGPKYWQQRADYAIKVTLDEARHRLTGRETITYTNHSPHTLPYLWMQLDQNIFRKDSARELTQTAPDFSRFGYRELMRILAMETFDGGFEIQSVKDRDGPIPHHIQGTMMRLDLKDPLAPGRSATIKIKWTHHINDATKIWGRGGYMTLDDDNDIFTIAQWYPRMASYDDVDGWQHKQFLGRGEFTLELGDYQVEITVPADHIVAATGTLENVSSVLTSTQRKRLSKAKKAKKVTLIITREEAEATSKEDARKAVKGTKTWKFEAENVRDFAFASSRTFVWDAMGVATGDGRTVTAQSFYPPVAEPLWNPYSTQAIAHTIEVYGRMTFPYPYPQATSVNGAIGGMEYPMICYNGPRAEDDGTYYGKPGKGKPWNRSKYGLISVVIHEVGHNWFPMIVNSDERQWTWMDEGLNSFLQYIAEQAWEKDYPSWRGDPKNITRYMTSSKQVPIMSNSESLLQFGNNAYGKPATALNILRETVMGRVAFDHAFKTYAQSWKFKRPMPSDFFRVMEDASSIDLDWFWRGWFYGTEHVDVAITQVNIYELDTQNPDIEKRRKRKKKDEEPTGITQQRNVDQSLRVNRFPELKDFYNSYDPLDVTESDREEFKKFIKGLEDDEKKTLETDRNFYVVDFENKGGLVTPLILRLTYDKGESEIIRIPAEIWRVDADKVSKLFVTQRELTRIEIDPYLETADTDVSNNSWPAKPVESRFSLFKRKKQPSPMKAAQDAKKKKAEDAKKKTEAKTADPVAAAQKKADDAQKKADDAQKKAEAAVKKAEAAQKKLK